MKIALQPYTVVTQRLAAQKGCAFRLRIPRNEVLEERLRLEIRFVEMAMERPDCLAREGTGANANLFRRTMLGRGEHRGLESGKQPLKFRDRT